MKAHLDPLLAELRVGEPYHEPLERLLQCAGARAADCFQEFAVELLESRAAGRPEPESLGLARARRWLKREGLYDRRLDPLVLTDADGRPRERTLRPLPMPAPAVRRQIRWGRRPGAPSAPPPPPLEADLLEAVRTLPLGERRAIQAVYGITGPPRRGRRSREVRRLAERALASLREALPAEHFAANLF